MKKVGFHQENRSLTDNNSDFTDKTKDLGHNIWEIWDSHM